MATRLRMFAGVAPGLESLLLREITALVPTTKFAPPPNPVPRAKKCPNCSNKAHGIQGADPVQARPSPALGIGGSCAAASLTCLVALPASTLGG